MRMALLTLHLHAHAHGAHVHVLLSATRCARLREHVHMRVCTIACLPEWTAGSIVYEAQRTHASWCRWLHLCRFVCMVRACARSRQTCMHASRQGAAASACELQLFLLALDLVVGDCISPHGLGEDQIKVCMRALRKKQANTVSERSDSVFGVFIANP